MDNKTIIFYEDEWKHYYQDLRLKFKRPISSQEVLDEMVAIVNDLNPNMTIVSCIKYIHPFRVEIALTETEDFFVKHAESTSRFQFICEEALVKIALYEDRILHYQEITEEERTKILIEFRDLKNIIIKNMKI